MLGLVRFYANNFIENISQDIANPLRFSIMEKLFHFVIIAIQFEKLKEDL